MTPRHAADRLTTWIRIRLKARRARREAAWDAEANWLPSLPEDQDLGPFDPTTKLPGQRYHGRHAQPGDIPDQPAGGAE